ncbi:hypothetical protein [Rhizobium sullae]|uniref:Uncharacterized protein n=2 Tax=Rhizobium sullae TaxID=50338 RepID=A0A4R3PSR4_RHISU|nr:hypothetical protein [Rhizobium sullae]TCU09656.1 hypothetical protein EV132_12456 [Rhizobium sullae]
MVVIHLDDARNEPDADLIKHDGTGRSFYKFACEFEMDGRAWAVAFWAHSQGDAEHRVEAMKRSLRCLGQIYSEGEM